jgi:hypothetical protein
MTNEDYLEVKDDYFTHIRTILKETGNIAPTVTIIGMHKEENKPAIVHIPLPPEIANSDEKKQEFVDKMIPELSKKVNERFTVDAVGFASEAWMRTAEKDEFDPEVDNYKKLPIKKEILIITLDNGNSVECNIFEIKRDGKSVTPDGDLIDIIELEKLPDLESTYPATEGRFSRLYEKFTKQ